MASTPINYSHRKPDGSGLRKASRGGTCSANQGRTFSLVTTLRVKRVASTDHSRVKCSFPRVCLLLRATKPGCWNDRASHCAPRKQSDQIQQRFNPCVRYRWIERCFDAWRHVRADAREPQGRPSRYPHDVRRGVRSCGAAGTSTGCSHPIVTGHPIRHTGRSNHAALEEAIRTLPAIADNTASNEFFEYQEQVRSALLKPHSRPTLFGNSDPPR